MEGASGLAAQHEVKAGAVMTMLTQSRPAVGQAAVQVRGLVKSYGSVQAVRGIDLEIRRGEIFALLGPNGAGKTTPAIRALLTYLLVALFQPERCCHISQPGVAG
jgi:ABC-type transporter Mla maintaining outer membrane lipid asymmetry ATPase subunit MlaF